MKDEEDVTVTPHTSDFGLPYEKVKYKKEYAGEFMRIEDEERTGKYFYAFSKADKAKRFYTRSAAIEWLVNIFKHA